MLLIIWVHDLYRIPLFEIHLEYIRSFFLDEKIYLSIII